MGIEIVAGGIGGMSGILLSQPLDVVRIRLACQDGRSKTYTGITSCLRKTLVGEGIRGIYKGVASPMAAMGILNAVLFYTYESLLRNLEGSNRVNKSTKRPTIWNIWIAASLSGFVSALINTPTELVKSVAQVDTKSKGTAREELYIAIKTFKNGGFGSRGLFRGHILITIRDVGSYGVYFAFYEWVCRKYEKRSKLVSFVSGGVAGALSWLSLYPVECFKARWQVSDPNVHTKMLPFFNLQVQREGYRFMQNGAGACALRAFPQTGALFTVYEYVSNHMRKYGFED